MFDARVEALVEFPAWRAAIEAASRLRIKVGTVDSLSLALSSDQASDLNTRPVWQSASDRTVEWLRSTAG